MSPGKNGDVTETKEKIELEETELNKVKAERSKLIEQLLEKANLEHEEKEKIQHTLNSKEEELQNLQFELARLNKRLLTAQLKDREQVTMAADMPGRNDAQDRVEMNMITRVIPDLMTAMGVPDGNYKINLRDVINFFNRKYWKDGRSPFSQDMVELGYCSPESGLNFSGARYMRNLIKSKI
ncbi:hypothetical protein SAMN02927897_00748 [Kosakonia sacchari]|uniref:Uncharacterized protein n=2 Tax=Kosakonia sacchari TaxID=1158459 RepID=A0A1G4XFP6_9ENTR|nr:hypothetical protein SAMN02927897_00748 [Kosakonia sacchari]